MEHGMEHAGAKASGATGRRALSIGLVGLAAGAALLAACGAASEKEEPAARVAESSALGLVAFDVVYDVLQHPRCLNCHPAGDRPLQFADHRPHVMNVQRGDDDRGRPGMRCTTCHGKANHDLEHLPPGVATEWHLAPREMAFEGLSKAEMAEMLLDSERSHMSVEQLVEHVSHDPLVLWGWDPGPGREPVTTTHADFVAAFKTWVEAGTPIPERE